MKSKTLFIVIDSVTGEVKRNAYDQAIAYQCAEQAKHAHQFDIVVPVYIARLKTVVKK